MQILICQAVYITVDTKSMLDCSLTHFQSDRLSSVRNESSNLTPTVSHEPCEGLCSAWSNPLSGSVNDIICHYLFIVYKILLFVIITDVTIPIVKYISCSMNYL